MYIAAGPFECKWHNKRVKRTFKIVYSSFALNCPESIRQFPVYRFAYSTVVVFNSEFRRFFRYQFYIFNPFHRII